MSVLGYLILITLAILIVASVVDKLCTSEPKLHVNNVEIQALRDEELISIICDPSYSNEFVREATKELEKRNKIKR